MSDVAAGVPASGCGHIMGCQTTPIFTRRRHPSLYLKERVYRGQRRSTTKNTTPELICRFEQPRMDTNSEYCFNRLVSDDFGLPASTTLLITLPTSQ